MGRNHHISLDEYIHKYNAEHYIQKANDISDGKYIYGFIVDYAKTRCGICHCQEMIDYKLNEHKDWICEPEIHTRHLLPQKEARKLKELRKRLSIALAKLDKFMEEKIGK